MTVSTRIAVMEDGHIRQIATPAQLYEQPNSRYVADFIGDVNLISATVRLDRTLNWADGQAPFQVETNQGISTNQQVWLALRPEKLAISKDKPDAPNAVQGKVIDIAYLGNLSTYVVEIAGGQKLRAQATNARRLANRDITWGDTVWLSWSETAGVVLVE